MRGTGRGIGGLVAALAVVAISASPMALAGDVKLAKPWKATLRTGQKLPFPARPAQGMPELDADGIVGPTTFSFAGLNFLSNTPVATFYWSSPGPDGAVGPDHVVSILRGSISWYSKTGVFQNTPGQRLAQDGAGVVTGSFFESLAPTTVADEGHVIYDRYNGRFVVLVNDWLATGAGDPVDSSAILIAVSDDSDPNGTWYYAKINAAAVVEGAASFAYALSASVTPDAILIAADYVDNAFTDYMGSRLIIVQKTPLYSGGAAVSNIYDPGTESEIGQVIGLVPAQRQGPLPEGVLTFLVSTAYYDINTSEELYFMIEVDGTAAAPVFAKFPISGGYSLGDISDETLAQRAAQQGTTRIINANGPTSALIWRGDDLWLADTVMPKAGENAGQPTVHWMDLNLFTGELIQGELGGEDIAAGTATYYPSINVNNAGSVAMSFVASGTNLYPGAYYTGRLATDTAGTWGTPKPLAVGVDYYYRVFGGSATNNRLGPTSATAVDPVTDNFWSYNSYAGSRGTIFTQYPDQDGRWVTRWGTFAITAGPGDFNFDSFVDDTDMNLFKPCLQGPEVAYVPTALPTGCDFAADSQGIIAADFDRDGDVDLTDWGIMQRCYAGPGVPADPNCAGS